MPITFDSSSWTSVELSKNSKFDSNGNFYKGIWHRGMFHAGIWYDGFWYNGWWLCGNWLNGKWNFGAITPYDDKIVTETGFLSKVSPKSFNRPKNTLSLNYSNYK